MKAPYKYWLNGSQNKCNKHDKGNPTMEMHTVAGHRSQGTLYRPYKNHKSITMDNGW